VHIILVAQRIKQVFNYCHISTTYSWHPTKLNQTNCIASIASILITLHSCCFQTNNMDKPIFVNKNWPSDPLIGCLKPINLAFTCEVEYGLMTKLEVKLKDEVEGKDIFNLHCSFLISHSPYM